MDKLFDNHVLFIKLLLLFCESTKKNYLELVYFCVLDEYDYHFYLRI